MDDTYVMLEVKVISRKPKKRPALLNVAAKCTNWGFPLTTPKVRMFAKTYLDKQGRTAVQFKNVPGKNWVYSLLKRHKTIVAQRISSNINKTRATVSRDIITKNFDNLKDTLRDVPTQNSFNYNETNFSNDPGKVKGIYRRGVKYPEEIVNHSKSDTTIMICGSADGTLLPQYVIYKSEHLYNTWKETGPKGNPCCSKTCCTQGCRYNRTSHGWMDSNTFHDWFESTFLPQLNAWTGKKC
ncbi:hypothetical protein NQ314_007609 [Rhamnusium bicolor]|uniref:DDE-1 domain-containing protein n=1 Tax=Rhamnusium bicolor TaxID=1586634 RepID=A0AAV8YME0_9CUCU|nr:hypothetical protein NQ314_007609 [Rhamnusium bicolor]